MTDDELDDIAAYWAPMLKCRCGAAAGQPCVALPGSGGAPPGTPMTRPHRYRDTTRRRGRVKDQERIDHCLTVWKRLCARQVPAGDIAEALGINLPALNQMVYRARKAGHADAVYHPNAQFKNPNPTRDEESQRRYRREQKRKLAKRRADERARHLLQLVQDSEQDETKE